MQIMVYLGKATPKVVNGLKSMSDDNDYMVYTSVSNFVQEAELRHLSFNRVIFNNKFVPRGEDDFVALNEFIRNFSSATELVMVINDGDKENEGLFNKYFSSPLHSCAIVKSAASMDFFRDIVSLPIVTVKARYYELDKGSLEKSKDSKIGGLRGGVKKPTENINTQAESIKADETISNVEISPRNTNEDTTGSNPVNVVSNTDSSTTNVGSTTNNNERLSGFSPDTPAPHEVVGSSSEDFVAEDDEDILSVGAFGSAHSDTDMFDEDDLDEIIEEPSNNSVSEEDIRRRKELEEQNRIAAEIQERNKSSNQKTNIPVNQQPVELKKSMPQNKWVNLKGTVYSANLVNFIISTPCSGSAQRIVDDAVRMMEAGMHVLLVDLDFVNNNLLSFINLGEYYKTNHNGYVGSPFYTEEGIDVLSGGYGFVPSASIVNSLLSDVVDKYDIVLVDCPTSSLQFINMKVFEGVNIVVFSGNDPSQIIATALSLSDRRICTVAMERLIMNKAQYILVGGKTPLVEETVNNMLFANGCWLK